MIIYIDLLMLLNFIYDYLILKVVSIVLKRNTNNIRLIISSCLGEISILFLILNFNYILLLICKFLLALLMNIISFKYKSIKYLISNLSYFYMISIILGGFTYFLYLRGINYIIILLLIPIILIIYIIQNKIKLKNNCYYDVVITFSNNHKIKVLGYLDTGNNLKSISGYPIIILNKKFIKTKIIRPIYVPIRVLNHESILTCFKVKYIEINNKRITKLLVGLSNNDIDVDCLLNINLEREINND